MLERLTRMQRLSDTHEALPAEQCEDLATGEGADQDRRRDNNDECGRVQAAASDRDSADGEHQITGCERDRHASLFEKHQPADHDHQSRPLETLEPADGVQTATTLA